MKLNAPQRAALVMVAVPVTTLWSYDASAGRVVVFAPSLAKCAVEELSVTPHDHFLVSAASAFIQNLMRLRL